MRSRWTKPALISLSMAVLCAGGCGPGSRESNTSPTTQRDNADANEQMANTGNDADHTVELGPVVTFVGLSAHVPTDWQSEMPTSDMRVAQFVLPGADGAGDASLVIYDFGPGQGGTTLDNINRWRGQVTDGDRVPVTPIIVEANVAGMSITKVEATGRYSSGMQGDGEVHADTTVINVQLIKSPEQSVFFKLVGPKETVAAHRAGFEAMLGSIKVAQ